MTTCDPVGSACNLRPGVARVDCVMLDPGLECEG